VRASVDGFVAGPFGRLHYLEEGTGAPLILLHGAGSSAYEFEHVIGLLAQHFRAIAWDMPGHGDSDVLPRHLTVGDYADALAALASGLDARPTHLVGTSIGAVIAAEAAVRNQADVASITLVEMPFRPVCAWVKMWPLVESIFSTPTQTHEQVAPRFRDLSEADFVRWNIDRNKAGGKAMMSAMWALRDHRPDLEAISVPTLLIYGEKGAVSDGIAAAEVALPGATRLTMPECGHFPMIDDPVRFSEIIHGFA